jgi:hypothetical protein
MWLRVIAKMAATAATTTVTAVISREEIAAGPRGSRRPGPREGARPGSGVLIVARRRGR